MHERETAEFTRRTALRRLLTGAAALPFVDVWTAGRAFAGDTPARPAGPSRKDAAPTARSVIEIWMSGGPAHMETFDPKPDAGQDWRGPFDKAIPTNVSGIQLHSLMPLLAQQADKFALLRGMSHGQNGHETATYITQTGRNDGGRIVYPSLGAVVSVFRGYDRGYGGQIPPYIVLTAPLGRFSETGFLGPRHRAFVTGGDPNARRFAVEGVVSEGISDERQRARRDLLHELDTLGHAMPRHPRFEHFDACEAKAYDLILGDAGKVFDMSAEPDALRERYGRNRFGQSCLMARRLVEQGVPYITIHSPGWDTHKQHFEAMRRRVPEIDRGLAALLADLSDRGLLASTVVWCCGEFGRTPRVAWEAPWNGGRSHYGKCFSALVAGGGFKGGIVVGATDAKGEEVADRPIHPRELHGAIYTRLGIDPDGPLPNPRGLDVKVTDEPPAAAVATVTTSPTPAKVRLPELV